ncbi:MAG TPA: urease accessory protein UreD [Gammaproteobacteria bacterium]|nr:urease accessory protein UreD [Gammaproteobacteria bacterium]
MAAVESSLGAWRGALALEFAVRGGRTIVAERRHEGPFCIQRPFHPGDGVCHVYLLHPPGGLAGGDELVLDTAVANGAASLLTTPAATKFYRSDGPASVQTQALRVAAGASLEWLPLDTILFGGSRARITTDVHLDSGARFAGWEMTSLGRPLSGDRYATGALEQRTRIYVDGEPRLLERLAWNAGDALLAAPWGVAGFVVCGALYAYPADAAVLEQVRHLLGTAATSLDDVDAAARADPPLAAGNAPYCGATLLRDLLVVRALGASPEELRAMFETLWCAIRPAVIARAPCRPRIWRT